MATEEKDWQAKEKEEARRAVSSLKGALNSSISKHFQNRSGELRKTNVGSRFRQGFLDRLVITSPRYSFMLHHGYNAEEDVKSTTRRASSVRAHFRGSAVVSGSSIPSYHRGGGVVSGFKRSSRFEGAGHISEAINNSNVLENLADGLAESRAVYVTSNILPSWERKI